MANFKSNLRDRGTKANSLSQGRENEDLCDEQEYKKDARAHLEKVLGSTESNKHLC